MCTRSLLLILLILFPLTSCTKKIYMPTEVIRVDSVSSVSESERQQFQKLVERLEQRVSIRDSVIIRDSVVLVVNELGDILSWEKYREREHTSASDKSFELIQARYDSLMHSYREELQSILTEMQKTPIPIEREFTRWEQIRLDCGNILLGLIASVLCIAVWWLIKKFRK